MAGPLRRLGAVASAGALALLVALGIATSLRNDGRLPRIDIVADPQVRELEARGDWERAASELEAALRFGVGARVRPGVLARLGVALAHLGRREQAIARFRESLALRPESDEVRRWLVNELAGAGRIEEAAAETRRLLLRSPDDPELLAHLADALELLGDPQGEVPALRRAAARASRAAGYGEGSASPAGGEASP